MSEEDKADDACPPFLRELTEEEQKVLEKEMKEWTKTCEQMSNEELAAAFSVSPEDTICFQCPRNRICKHAWDPLNADSDCIWAK